MGRDGFLWSVLTGNNLVLASNVDLTLLTH